MGLVNVQLRDYSVAETALPGRLRANPNSAATNLQAGSVFFQAGRIKLAVQRDEAVGAISPRSAECQGNLGAALLSQGRTAEAKTGLSLAALKLADNPQCHYNLAVFSLQRR